MSALKAVPPFQSSAPVIGGTSRRGRRARYLDRELSWLEFNARVLFEARDQRNPLVDRLRFLTIFANNLDEFFQIRVAGLRQQVRAGITQLPAEGQGPAAQLRAVRSRVVELAAEQSAIYRDLRRDLRRAGVAVLDYAEVPEDHAALRQRFIDEIHPVLTPLAVDPGHRFPYISTLTLSIAVGLRDPETGVRRFARVKVPPVLPRFLELEQRPDQPLGHHRFVLLDQVIEANLDLLFAGMAIEEHHLFRVTRNADLALEEDEADDLLLAIEEELRRRRFGEAVRLEVERSMPASIRKVLLGGIGVTEDQVYEVRGMLDLTGLGMLTDLDRPDLRSEPWAPVTPRRFQRVEDDEPVDTFEVIRAGDVLVHHPYESFATTIERFVAQATDDPDVLTIKLTLYRTSGDSPIIQDLIEAAERGKQVVAIVEIKARFDERANIAWARKLEQAGAHVVYGMVGLKTHSKTLLVVRRESGVLRRYVHIGTGNYNSRTARQYVDLGLLTCRADIAQDVTDLFNVLTGLARQPSYRRLLIAPQALRGRFLALVEREITHARAGRAGGIILKLNALVDRECIDALYRASGAGVEIDLIVRGGCTLLPAVPGLSERIRVRSIIGEFLEHSRIWRFENAGEPEWFIGSADLMERNLDRRIEAFTPVLEPELQRELDLILATMLADDRRSWTMQSDGSWTRVDAEREGPPTVDTHATLKERALRAALAPAFGGPAGPPAGVSLEPWA
ncbi:MAG: polyphosphate kinase 1 [Chloroflexi bacterium]|nr:polyphosphate kinase 1 [Chloroflexota bacterium]